MIYKFTFSCEEGSPDFRLVFEADPDATFLELHEAILKAVGYPDDQMTSFFLCNDEWEKGQEVTLVEMDSNFEYDNMVMNDTRLSDIIEEQAPLDYKLVIDISQQICAALAHAHKNGISIIGDIPIYVAFDSADTWSHPEMFQFDEDNIPISVHAIDENAPLLEPEDIQASMDLSECREEGIYTIPVEIVLPEGYELNREVTVTVSSASQATSSENDSNMAEGEQELESE